MTSSDQGSNRYSPSAGGLPLLPPVIPAVFRFRVCRDVNAQRFYTGPMWYAFAAARLGISADHTLADTGLVMAPLDRGGSFHAGDELRLVVTSCGPNHPEVLASAFRTGGATCRRRKVFSDSLEFLGYDLALPTGMQAIQPGDWPRLVAPEVAALREHGEFTVRFETPLRLKGDRHKAGRKPLPVLPEQLTLRRLLWACWTRLHRLAALGAGHPRAADAVPAPPDPLPDDSTLLPAERLVWLDAPYRSAIEEHKITGGILGETRVCAKLSEFWAQVLLIAGGVHVGESIAFGFGRITVSEAAAVAVLPSHRPAAGLVERISDMRPPKAAGTNGHHRVGRSNRNARPGDTEKC